MFQISLGFMHKVLILVLAVWLTTFSSLGFSSAPGLPSVVEIGTSMQCAGPAGATVFVAKDEMKKASSDIQSRLAEANVDWQTNHVLQINMGVNPNAGYRLEFLGEAQIKEQVLIIPVRWWSPKPGAMYSQMMVSPCLILMIPKLGFQKIQIVDAVGELRWTLPSP